MLIAMRNGQPDSVPVSPDTSNMIPCKLTGKPFWDIYLYQDPPLWQAYIDTVKHYEFDGWLPGVPLELEADIAWRESQPQWREAIVARTPERIYTRLHRLVEGVEQWTDWCNVYYIADPPTVRLPLSKVGLPTSAPTEWEEVEARTSYPGLEAYRAARQQLGEAGVVGVCVGLPGLGLNPESSYEWYDNPSVVIARCEQYHEATVKRTEAFLALDPQPDLILIGISGFMITNPEPIFRQLALPTLQAVTKLCKEAGVISQIHCCGPERQLVKLAAEESDLDNINPLEPPPMGDCDLADLKRRWGDRISLMGNLHTTEVMLLGSVEKVIEESKRAIDDAGAGGGFILSTGDQCGRDTPDENLYAMIETARNYGRY